MSKYSRLKGEFEKIPKQNNFVNGVGISMK